MKFVFLHHEVHGPISLESVWEGTHGFAGSVSRLRVIFWLAGRGHEVVLAGNVQAGSFRQVRAVPGVPWETLFPAMTGSEAPPCFLIINNPPEEALWSAVAARRDRFHALLWLGNPLPNHTWLSRAALGCPSRIICVSEYHRDLYRVYPGFEAIEAWYSGLDVDLVEQADSHPASQPTALFCSMPRRTKGLHHLLRQWVFVRQRVPNALLKITGSVKSHDPRLPVGRTGVLDSDIEEEFPDFFSDPPESLRRHGIELLWLPGLRQVYETMKSVQVAVVNCNLRGSLETFCKSAVEAQMAGIPVVGAAAGALPEVVVNGKTGFLFRQHRHLSEILVRLFENAELRRTLGAAGRVWARNLAGYEPLSEELEAMAQRVVRGEAPPHRHRWISDTLRHVGYGRIRAWGRNRLRNTRVERQLIRWISRG